MPDGSMSLHTQPEAKSLKTLLRCYRRTYRDLGKTLKEIDEKDWSDPAAERSAIEAAHAPNDAAREAMIAAPIVTFADIVTKLRFYFEVGGNLTMFDNPPNWEAQIVKNILRDIDKPSDGRQPSITDLFKASNSEQAALLEIPTGDTRNAGREIWRAADDIDIATHGALSAVALVFGVLEDADRVVPSLEDAEGKYLRGYIDQLYYLIRDLHDRVKKVRQAGADIADLSRSLKAAPNAPERAARDEPLVKLWERVLVSEAEFNHTSEDDEAAHNAAERKMGDAAKQFLNATPTTPLGIALKLKYLARVNSHEQPAVAKTYEARIVRDLVRQLAGDPDWVSDPNEQGCGKCSGLRQ
jgi:hypothetical protein